MRRYSLQFYCIWIIVLLVAIVLEMTFIPKIIRDKLKKTTTVLEPPDVHTRPIPEEYGESEHYGVGVYYSNWSPYEPRLHFPHEIDLKKVTRINYAFFIVDDSSGKIKSSDDWSDFKMDIKYPGKPDRITGALGELNYLKLQPENDFKLIMAVGGWSNREAFHKIVKSEKKMSNFITSCIDTMFEYGFDGIDLDWEFPKDDGFEPAKYLEMCARLREGMDELENKIWGPEKMSKPRFELSMATPAFAQSLEILPIPEMDKYICVWNMMTYDFHGSWSKRTGYHSNLYNLTNNPDKTVDKRRFEDLGIEELDGLNSHEAVMIMVEKFGVNPRKINLGMAAYGRGFTKVQNDGDNYLERPYSGVGGLSEGEPGIWLYNQLPIKNSTEQFDDVWVSAYCFDPDTRTFVGYDNVESMKIKQEYVMKHKLAGGFWWESCGDDHKDPERNLVNAFTKDMELARVASSYKEEELMRYYLQLYPNGFLSQQFRAHQNKRRNNN